LLYIPTTVLSAPVGLNWKPCLCSVLPPLFLSTDPAQTDAVVMARVTPKINARASWKQIKKACLSVLIAASLLAL